MPNKDESPACVDIREDDLLAFLPEQAAKAERSAEVLDTLLRDHTTGKNIFWATHDYEALGSEYSYHSEILLERKVKIILEKYSRKRPNKAMFDSIHYRKTSISFHVSICVKIPLYLRFLYIKTTFLKCPPAPLRHNLLIISAFDS